MGRQTFENAQDPELRLIWLYHCFGLGAGRLNQLWIYLQEHERISDNNVMTKYYACKHNTALKRSKERGWLENAL